MNKVAWSGEVLGVQPRIDLLRSYDERQHSYLGYLLVVRGEMDGQEREFCVRIGPISDQPSAVSRMKTDAIAVFRR